MFLTRVICFFKHYIFDIQFIRIFTGPLLPVNSLYFFQQKAVFHAVFIVLEISFYKALQQQEQ
jgi:hypothetical protein